MNAKLLSLPEAAEACSVSRWTLWNYVKANELKCSRTPGGHYRISEKDLKDFMTRKGMHPEHNTQTVFKTVFKKVLVVDDEASVRKLLIKKLSKMNCEVKDAADGFEAGQMTVSFKPDIIILDIFMPEMNGFEVCRRLKNDPETSDIKIIAITGFDTINNKEQIFKCGADVYFSKPLDFVKLQDEINKD